MSIDKLFVAIVCCFFTTAASNAKVAYVYSSKSMLEVNSIKYSNNGTTIVFFNCQSAPKCIYAVGDGGKRFKALSLSYAKEKGELSVTFEPIPFGNKAIDVVAPGDFKILGLHDASSALDIPKAKGMIEPAETDESLYQEKMVEIKGRIRDFDAACYDWIYCQDNPFRITKSFSKADRYFKIDATGRFDIKLPIDHPSDILLSNGTDGIYVNHLYVRPGDNIELEFDYKASGNEISIKNNSARPTYSKYSNCTHVWANYVECMVKLNDRNHSSETRQFIVDAYKQNLGIADYICWHYDLSPFETEMYLAKTKETYISAMTMLNMQADMQDFSFLKELGGDNLLYFALKNAQVVPSNINVSTKFKEISNKYEVDNPSSWTALFNEQNGEWNSISGMKGVSYWMQAAFVDNIPSLVSGAKRGKHNIQNIKDGIHQVTDSFTHPYFKGWAEKVMDDCLISDIN